MADPEPVIRQLVRVVVGEDTYCPGFQFQPGGALHPGVNALFDWAPDLKASHNHFTAWVTTPSRRLDGNRPVDLHQKTRLFDALETSAR